MTTKCPSCGAAPTAATPATRVTWAPTVKSPRKRGIWAANIAFLIGALDLLLVAWSVA